MNKRRLLKLADLLEADASNRKGVKFDLGTVFDAKGPKPKDGILKMDCGTNACAMGLAALSGAFKRAGLDYEVYDADWHDNDWDIQLLLDGRATDYVTASTRVFDIDNYQSHFLFDSGSYPKNRVRGAVAERFVAQRIRDLVAGKIEAPT